MFAVCVAAAINRTKVNLLLQFSQAPSAAQVMSRAIAAFTQLQQDRGIFTPFFCNCAMIFDDASSRWVPLERSSQLVHNAQVYLFQPDVPDVAGAIPDPIPADTFLVDYRSPPRGANSISSSRINASQTTYDPSPRGLMPQDPDLSRFPVERNVPVNASRNLDFGGGAAGAPGEPYTYATYSRASDVVRGSRQAGYDDDSNPLSPEQREILRREANRAGSTFVPGGSILAEERQREDAKVKLGLDEHRNRVREETKRFVKEVSPQRNTE